jgi:hypothetical protein
MRFVGKGVAADDRLVRLHRFAGEAGEQLARLEQQRRPNGRVVRQPISAHAQRHHDLQARLPARSPIPLIAHSTWRTPPVIAAGCWRPPGRDRRDSAR